LAVCFESGIVSSKPTNYGRPLEETDENGVRTEYAYNPEGQVKTVRRAVGTPDETLTYYSYDLRGDLVAIDPPNAFARPDQAVYDPASGHYPTDANVYCDDNHTLPAYDPRYRTTFDYRKYELFNNVPTLVQPERYEARLTRRTSPDGTDRFYHYNAAGETDWIQYGRINGGAMAFGTASTSSRATRAERYCGNSRSSER
jgi:YD repeat-containing protein